jgi:ribosomal protein L29
MKASELRSKTREELGKELSALLQEKFSLNMQRSSAVSEMKTHHIARVRKDIARVLTVLNEMEK